MKLSRLTRVSGATTATAVLVLCAACGSSSSGGSSGGSSSGGSDSSGSGDSDSAAALTRSDIFSTLTDAQKKAGSYTFALDVKAAGMSTTGTGRADVSGSAPAVEAKVGVAGQQVETIAKGGFVYIKGSSFGTDKWIKIDTTDKSGPGALFAGSSDPAKQFAAIADAASVKKGGTEQVGGVETTEYDVSVPSSAVTKSNPTFAKLASSLPKTIEYDLFVDQDNLLRKLETGFTVAGQKVDTEATFSDYGKSVSVEAPPAGQTTTKFNFGALGGSTTS